MDQCFVVESSEVVYEVDGKTMRGHLAWPDRPGPQPAVLIGHEGIGLNDFQRARADHLAELGFVAFAMDYNAGRWYADPSEMMSVLGPLIADPDRMREVGAAALQVLLDDPRVDPSRVAAIGYGTGGTIVLELGRAGSALAAIAAVNPVLPTDRPEQWVNVTCPLLVCAGSHDPLAPPDLLDQVAEQLRSAVDDWQLIIYGGAEHAFHLPPLRADGSLADGPEHDQATPGVSYHPVSARRAWRAVVDHLDDALGGPEEPSRIADAAARWR